MNKNSDNHMYLLYHFYEYGENNEMEEYKILGIYSSENKAKEAIERYYNLEGFKKYPKECFEIEEYIIDVDAGWNEGFVNSDDLEQEFETLTTCFNKWLGNNKEPQESWEDNAYYNALCDVNSIMYKTESVNEFAKSIRQIWVQRLKDESKSFEEFVQIATTIIDIIT